MKIMYLLAAALILFSLVGVSFAAESVEVRSNILTYDGYWYDDNFVFNEYYISAGSWSAMYYDLKNGISTESVDIYGTDSEGEYLNPGHLYFVYYTSPVPQKFEYNWTARIVYYDDYYDEEYYHDYTEVFAILGFFGEPYVALSNETILMDEWGNWDYPISAKANKIAPLVMNDDENFSLKVGDIIDLGKGYVLYVEQIDVKGNKTNLVLKHNDIVLNSSVVNATESGDWIFKTDVLDEKKVQVLRVHVKDVFQGSRGDSIVEIDGLWLVDYLNAFEVKSDVDYGKWNATSISSEELVYVAEDIALSSNATVHLGKNWSVKVQDGFEIPPENVWDINDYEYNNRFYLFKEYTEPGKYEIRSSISDAHYTYNNFAAFYYELDKNLATEVLNINYSDGKFVGENDDWGEPTMYLTTYVHTDYEYLPVFGADENDNLINSWDSGYDIMGYFGEKYVPLNVVDNNGFYVYDSTKLDKFAPLVMDDDTKYTLNTDGWIELGGGYTLHVSQIDIDGNKAYLELHKDGSLVNSSIVTTNAGEGSGNWIYKDTILNVKDVQILRVHVKDVFQGSQDELVEIDGIWLTDFKNVTDLKSDDEVGLMKYEGLHSMDSVRDNFSGDYTHAFDNLNAESVLVFILKNNLTLSDEMDQVIANNMSLKAYEDNNYNPPAESRLVQPMSYNPYGGYRYYFYVTEEIGNLSSGEGDGGGDGDDDESDDDSSNPDDNPNEEDSPSDLISGFGAIVAGLFLLLLLIVAAYLYRRYMTRKAQANQNKTNEK